MTWFASLRERLEMAVLDWMLEYVCSRAPPCPEGDVYQTLAYEVTDSFAFELICLM